MKHNTHPVRHLVLVLGDQLNLDASAFDGFDPSQDRVWMAEVDEESTHVPSAKQRIALFLSAMRHFAQEILAKGYPLSYTQLEDTENAGTLHGELANAIQAYRPQKVVMTAPGDYRVLKALQQTTKDKGLVLEVRDDTHFYTAVRDFAAHAKGRKQLRMEFWYRALRKRFSILMTDGKPVGGEWNYDQDNRGSFGKKGPQGVPQPPMFTPDAITQAVIEMVNTRFATHAGRLDSFIWPVNRDQALQALAAFVQHRLPHFGQYQDAMWTKEPFLYHSLISSCLNLKLLNPREVVDAAIKAYESGHAPLAAVEGFVRQILGWREYVRGIYWTQMPDYLERNSLGATAKLPWFFWTGETEMTCMKDAIGQTLDHGYAHHIQRLMVIGLYALLHNIHPKEVHAWYLSVYVDAVEWVELPNTLGMSQYADGGVMASKPYVATGKYIERMSNYCKGCNYDPSVSVGETACPFTTQYWKFLRQHKPMLSQNPRMSLQLKNLAARESS